MAWSALWTFFCLLHLVGASITMSSLPVFKAITTPPTFEVWVGDLVAAQIDDRLTPSPEVSTALNKSSVPTKTLDFPLQRTEVNAEVVSGVVHAKVKQVYFNKGTDCLQSRYIFPLPTKAAISAMSMHIGTRTVTGEIRTRTKARQEFLAARAAGKSASLLDQERPNVFAMELANIQPGEATEVVVEYSETLSPIDGVYAFTFPTVVGPRYMQTWAAGKTTSNLDVHVNLTVAPSCLGMFPDETTTVQGLTHEAGVTQAQAVGKNADVVLKFWFTEKAVGAQFLLANRGSDKYFSLSIQPPQRQLLSSDQISKREYLFILDVSGSMTGYPIDLSKKLMTKLLKENVRSGDSLNILLFAGGSAVLNENGNVAADAESVNAALAWLDVNMVAGGGTELLPALRRAFTLPRFHTSVARTIVVMTDGYVAVEKEAFDLVRENLGEGNVFVFGIGSSVNRYLIEGLARVGYGEPFVVTNEEEGEQKVAQLQRYIDSPVLTQLQLSFGSAFKPSEQEPPHLPDVFASRPIHVVGKWLGERSGDLRLTGRLADGTLWEYSADLATVYATEMPAVALLWARSRIATLGDYEVVGQAAEEQITALGLEYSLMTQYTSFVAVDSDPSGPAICKAEANNTNSSMSQSEKPGDSLGHVTGAAASASGSLSIRCTIGVCIACVALLSQYI